MGLKVLIEVSEKDIPAPEKQRTTKFGPFFRMPPTESTVQELTVLVVGSGSQTLSGRAM